MQTISQTITPVKRYAVYHSQDGAAVYGESELLVGFGWLFRSDDGQWCQLLTRADLASGKADLFGWVELAEAQHAHDMRFGSVYRLIDDRNSEHARVA